MTVVVRHRVTGAEMRVDDSQVDFWTERGYRPGGDSSAKTPAAKAPAKKAPAKAKK